MPDFQWEVASLRLTIFPAEPIAESDAERWWTQVFHQKPDRLTAEPREDTSTRVGEFEVLPGVPSALTLRVSPNRTDWLLQPVEKWEDATPTLGDWSGPTAWFLETLRGWLAEASPALRLAFGLVLVAPAANLVESTARVASLVAVKVDPATTSDFVFRINRKRPSRVLSEVTVNRLVAWSSMTVRAMNVHLPTGTSTETDLGVVTRLDLDINTAPTTAPLKPETLPDLLQELHDYAIELATEGDQP